jgi:cysteine desulfurase family protein
MSANHRIYLDNAATTWPKPPAVYEAVDRYQRQIGAPNGRSGYYEALESNSIVEHARRGVAELLGVADPGQIVFGYSGTDVLNIAIHGVLHPGDHVVTTVCDHNSVLRPLTSLRETAGIDVTYVGCDAEGFVSPDDVRAAITPKTKLVVVNHASNVTGAVQAIDAIGRVVRESDAIFLVDAAQSLGHLPIDVRALEVDLLAAPGHKGLLAPLGTGVLYIRPGIEKQLSSFRFGGTGTQSDEDRQPDELPEKYEPGNHNLPGLAGLAAATDFLNDQTIAAVHAHYTGMTARLLAGLRGTEGVVVHGPQSPSASRTSVVSITVEGYDPQELAAVLEASHRIQCRAGLHCAPRMHVALGTAAGGGTVRLSPGFSTTLEEIDAAVAAVQEVATVAIK